MSTWVVEQLLFIMALLRAFNQAPAIARSNEECKKVSFFSLCNGLLTRRCSVDPWRCALKQKIWGEKMNKCIWMWFHCLLIFAFSSFLLLCKEQNLVMMALLRFYNISTLRVGGNTEFEGETPKKKTWKFIALTNATKAMTTNTIFTMMPPDLLKPRQFPGQVAVWLFNFWISLRGFKCRCCFHC